MPIYLKRIITLVEKTVFQNGVYLAEDDAANGYNQVTVNVPPSDDQRRGLIDGSATSIDIPEGTTTIGKYAFNGCSALTSVTIPSSVTTISEGAFYYCVSLTNVIIPEGVTVIDKSIFYGCSSLVSVTIPSNTTTISGNAFCNCTSLASVTIPPNVTTIGGAAFGHCTSLQTLKFKRATPATAGTAAFVNVPKTCTIYVPTGSLSEYTSASNYPQTSDGYTYVEYSE